MQKQNRLKTQRLAIGSMLCAAALSLSYAEGLFFSASSLLPVGAKPGLSNLAVMLCARTLGFGWAMCITLFKAVFALATRGMTAFLMSASGGILSTVVLIVLLRLRLSGVSFIGISVLCAAAHNLGQLACAAALSGSAAVLWYLKYLLLFSVLTGFVCGVCANSLEPFLKRALL